VNPPKPFEMQVAPFKHGLGVQASPKKKSVIQMNAIKQSLKLGSTKSKRTCFASRSAEASRTYTLITPVAIDRLTSSPIHARITLTCLTNFTSTSRISWWAYTTITTIISHATALIHARLRSTRITLIMKEK
jgi:hypothetical protein